MLIPSTIDNSLAPAGQHVASLFCQHFDPYMSANWQDRKEQVADLITDTVNKYAPSFREQILGRMVLSPLDLEQQFSLTGGDISHGRLSQDRLFSARPMLGIGNYRSPINSLYSCVVPEPIRVAASAACPATTQLEKILRDSSDGFSAVGQIAGKTR